MPYSPAAPKGASSTDPTTWTTFDEAARYGQEAHLDGVMRAFDTDDGLVGVDLDGCRDVETGELAPWAAAIVKRLDTYTEVSPSGTGVKLWAYGILPPHGRKKGDVEMYDRARLFTLTGQHVPGTPAEVGYRPDAVLAVHRDVFGNVADLTAGPRHRGSGGESFRPTLAVELGDEEVIRVASESLHNGERFRRLWSGDTSAYARDGNAGRSEADAALCEILAFYGGPDRERIDRLFRRSGLAREKWERADYRERTLDLALRDKTRFYGESVQATSTSDGPSDGACKGCPHRTEEMRLRRLLLDRDDLIESQQVVIRSQRRELEEKTAYITHITEVLAKPNEELSSTEKVVALALAYETHYRADRGRTRLPLGALAERTGLSKGTVSTASRSICERPDSPFERKVTREVQRDADGVAQWVTTVEVAPRTDRTEATLRAIAKLPKAPARQRHGGSPQAAEARHRRCPKHRDSDVTIHGRCSTCGADLGAREVSAEAWAALNLQIEGSGDSTPPVSGVLKSDEARSSEPCDRRNGSGATIHQLAWWSRRPRAGRGPAP